VSIAFFDVDGTLLPPSLERRFFWNLFRGGKIPAGNCFHWTAEMFRLGAAGPAKAVQSNKMYLRGVSTRVISEMESQEIRHWVPQFFPAAIQRIWWHALRGDTVVLVTGTLAPLGEIVKSALERELLWRGVEAQIPIIATRLTERDGCWTGCILGVAMLGAAKAAAIRQFASSTGVPLPQCFAYGDRALDRPMLEAVGNPFAVNPTSRLRRIARHNGWPVMLWSPCPRRTATMRHALKWKGEAAL
jgi:HAD superfamily hydrolase (TIGR01490 family)